MNTIAAVEFMCFQIVMYYILFQSFLKITLKRIVCICVTNVVILYWVITTDIPLIVHLISMIILYVIQPIFLNKETPKRDTILFVVFLLGIFSIGEFLIDVIVMILFYKQYISLKMIYSIGVTCLMILLGSFAKIKQRMVIFYLSERGLKLLVDLSVWLVFVLLFGINYLLPGVKKYSIVFFYGIITLLCIIAVIFLCYMLITNNLQKRHYEKINGLIEHDYNNQVRYYENMNKANEDLRKFRHDYENMKIGLFTYLENEDYKGAYAYLQQGDELVRQGSCVYNTGHAIANALLSDKAGQVADENIKIEFHGIIPCDALTPIDLCIVLGNTLDNAIEACRRMPSDETKEIHISVKTKKNFMFVTITNPTYEQVRIINNRVTTTKKDKSSHGIGLYSVERVVKKYGGDLNLTYEDDLFTIKLDFEIQRELLQVT